MTDDRSEDEPQAGRRPKPSPRTAAQKIAAEQRLKQALRDNLRRRKAQARGRDEGQGEPLEANGATRLQDKAADND